MKTQTYLMPVGKTEVTHKRRKTPVVILVFSGINKSVFFREKTPYRAMMETTLKKFHNRGPMLFNNPMPGFKHKRPGRRDRKGLGPVSPFTTIRMLRRARSSGWTYSQPAI